MTRVHTSGELSYTKSYYSSGTTGHDYAGGLASSPDEKYLYVTFYSDTLVSTGSMGAVENLRVMKLLSADGSILSTKGSYSQA